MIPPKVALCIVPQISKVKVALTLGHSASHRAKTANSDDFTHDWSFYVRGDHGCKIHNYIDRVVFKLHESFKNPIQGERSVEATIGTHCSTPFIYIYVIYVSLYVISLTIILNHISFSH